MLHLGIEFSWRPAFRRAGLHNEPDLQIFHIKFLRLVVCFILTYGRSGKRFLVKSSHLISPILTQFTSQNFLMIIFSQNVNKKLIKILQTSTCQVGMKSALCLTLSKAFCNSGLIIVLS